MCFVLHLSSVSNIETTLVCGSAQSELCRTSSQYYAMASSSSYVLFASRMNDVILILAVVCCPEIEMRDTQRVACMHIILSMLRGRMVGAVTEDSPVIVSIYAP